MDVTSVTNATRECIASIRARSSWIDADRDLPWERLAALAEPRRFDADAVITRQFAPATHLFLVGAGAVRFQLRL
jgi:hypothetical protein